MMSSETDGRIESSVRSSGDEARQESQVTAGGLLQSSECDWVIEVGEEGEVKTHN